MLGTKLSVALPWACRRRKVSRTLAQVTTGAWCQEYLEKHLILKLLNHHTSTFLFIWLGKPRVYLVSLQGPLRITYKNIRQGIALSLWAALTLQLHWRDGLLEWACHLHGSKEPSKPWVLDCRWSLRWCTWHNTEKLRRKWTRGHRNILQHAFNNTVAPRQ